MRNGEDSIRRDALARDLARRQALASHDELRVVDLILLALERLREQDGPLELDANARDWRFESVFASCAIETLDEATFLPDEDETLTPGYRAGWNNAIGYVLDAFTKAQDGRMFEAIAQLKAIDRERAALYEAAAAEHLERLQREA
jgi:hypothetical protein